MEFIKIISDSNNYLSYLLFGISIYLYLNQITFYSVKKFIENFIQNTTKDFYKNQIVCTNDSIDYNLLKELEQLEKNNFLNKNFDSDINY
jgi:hypothetical protein